MQTIAYLNSPFKQKFGLPRQPGLIQSVDAYIVMEPPFNDPCAFTGIEGFSHLWLQFIFHDVPANSFKPMVRPPRLGGNEKTGVFACRSPFRPNRIGLSLVEFKGIEKIDGKLALRIACPDMLDGTPILDIKPYIPYADTAMDAQCDMANQAPGVALRVEFSDQVLAQIDELTGNDRRYTPLAELIVETLGYDPRPAYKNAVDDKEYALRLYDLDVKWRIHNGVAQVWAIVKV